MAPKAEEPPTPKLKLNFSLEPSEETVASVSASHLPPTAPQTPVEALEEEILETKEQSVENEQGLRRGSRKRTKSHASDVVFGSELDSLIDSASMDKPAKRVKVKGDEDVHIASSPPRMASTPPPLASSPPRKSILKNGSKRASTLTRKVHFATEESPPSRDDSSTTVQGDPTPPRRCTEAVSSDVSNILNALQSTSEVQVDLPNLTGPDGSKNYTSAVLFELYLQCYKNHLWNYCDLIADTWIRALHKANKRSQRKKCPSEYMWRENRALEKVFAQKGKGFKKNAPDYGLDVEDPAMDRDVTALDPARLSDLFTHTDEGCGARLLWADAMALGGQKVEHEITQNPAVWPKDLFYDVMCTSLRLVRRKLTLKIEEKYEGAWCRYHEHAKHKRPCYRKLAWKQQGRRSRQASVVGNGDDDYDSMYGSEYGDEKHVRFEEGFDVKGGFDASVLVDYEGEDDTGSESEEER